MMLHTLFLRFTCFRAFQVSVAVLLDKFITATVDMESEQRQLEIEEIKKKKEVRILSPFHFIFYLRILRVRILRIGCAVDSHGIQLRIYLAYLPGENPPFNYPAGAQHPGPAARGAHPRLCGR